MVTYTFRGQYGELGATVYSEPFPLGAEVGSGNFGDIQELKPARRGDPVVSVVKTAVGKIGSDELPQSAAERKKLEEERGQSAVGSLVNEVMVLTDIRKHLYNAGTSLWKHHIVQLEEVRASFRAYNEPLLQVSFKKEKNNLEWLIKETVHPMHSCTHPPTHYASWVGDLAVHLFSAVSTLSHYSIAHLDIKPDNILYSEFPDEKRRLRHWFVLADFGGAWRIGDPRMSHACVTEAYAALEVHKGEKHEFNSMSDLWCVGITILECMGVLCAPRCIDCIEGQRKDKKVEKNILSDEGWAEKFVNYKPKLEKTVRLPDKKYPLKKRWFIHLKILRKSPFIPSWISNLMSTDQRNRLPKGGYDALQIMARNLFGPAD